jgi:hypothetical protein
VQEDGAHEPTYGDKQQAGFGSRNRVWGKDGVQDKASERDAFG